MILILDNPKDSGCQSLRCVSWLELLQRFFCRRSKTLAGDYSCPTCNKNRGKKIGSTYTVSQRMSCIHTKLAIFYIVCNRCLTVLDSVRWRLSGCITPLVLVLENCWYVQQVNSRLKWRLQQWYSKVWYCTSYAVTALLKFVRLLATLLAKRGLPSVSLLQIRQAVTNSNNASNKAWLKLDSTARSVGNKLENKPILGGY